MAPDPWPLTGRDGQRKEIDDAFADPDLGGVVLVGEAGSGLTRLARDALNRLAGHGCRTEWVPAAVASGAVPFEAVAHLLPDDCSADQAPLAVIRATARALAGRTRVVLAIDDVHLLDPASAALVCHLVTRQVAFVILTLHRGRPTAGSLATLWKEHLLARVQVPPLPPEGTDALVGYALGGAVDGITRRRLHAAAGGRPAVLRELLVCGHESGSLRRRYGVWRWYGSMAGSGRVAEAVVARLAACPPAARAVAELVACGEPLPLALLERLADRAAIAAAERSGLITVDRDGARITVLLSSPLHGDAIRGRLPVAEARLLYGRLVEAALAGPLRRRDDPARLAAWQRESGTVAAPDLLLPAARYLLSRDPDLAEWSARAALPTAPGEAGLLLAQILEYGGRSAEAAAVLDACAPDPHGLWAVTRATVLYWGLGRPDHAREALDRPGSDLADALRSWILLFDGACEPALELAREVLNGPSTSEQALVWAAAAGAGAAGLAGRVDEALHMRRRGLVVARTHADGLPWARAQVEYGACTALLLAGELNRAAALAEEEYRAAAAAGAPLLLGGWALLRGVLAAAAGRVVTAQAHLREAAALLEETDARLVGFALAELAAAAAMAGDPGQADTWLARAGEHAPGAGPGRGANRVLDRGGTGPGPGWPPRRAAPARRWRCCTGPRRRPATGASTR